MPGDYLISGWDIAPRLDPSGKGRVWLYRVQAQYLPLPPDTQWRFKGPPVPTAEATGTAILIWRFDDAPGELQALSGNGGDEDWIALIPAGMKDEWIPWLDSDSFGCCDRSRYDYDGRIVVIGSHA